jgi:hypothetical protein
MLKAYCFLFTSLSFAVFGVMRYICLFRTQELLGILDFMDFLVILFLDLYESLIRCCLSLVKVTFAIGASFLIRWWNVPR